MCEEFLAAVLSYIQALNEADKKVIPKFSEGLTPYLGRIPVILENSLCGWLEDVADGAWTYQDATKEEVDEYDAKYLRS